MADAKENPWRPLGEVVKWGVPCEFEWRNGTAIVCYQWSGSMIFSENIKNISFEGLVLQPVFRLHVPETADTVLAELNVISPVSAVSFGHCHAGVIVRFIKKPTLEKLKRIAPKFRELVDLVRSGS